MHSGSLGVNAATLRFPMLRKWSVNSSSLLAFISFFIQANNIDMCIQGGSCCFSVVAVVVGFVYAFLHGLWYCACLEL